MSLFIEPESNSKKQLIVSFAGHDLAVGTIKRFEFLRFLSKHFPHVNQHFHMDENKQMYHLGIKGHTTNVEETVDYLREKIKEYQCVLFLGVSSGGYAAILFGSLLGITNVLAFIPQTKLDKDVEFQEYRLDEKYTDLAKWINPRTRYVVVGDQKEKVWYHHISHCDHIGHFPNVKIIRKNSLNLHHMRDYGELLELIRNVLKS